MTRGPFVTSGSVEDHCDSAETLDLDLVLVAASEADRSLPNFWMSNVANLDGLRLPFRVSQRNITQGGEKSDTPKGSISG